MKHLSKFAVLVLFLALVSSCKGGKEQPVVPEFDVDLILPGYIELAVGEDLTLDVRGGKAPSLSDVMQFESVELGNIINKNFKAVSSTSATVEVPKTLVSGRWTLTVKRDNKNKKTIGTTTFKVTEKKDDYKPAEGTTVYGKVSCAGNGLAGVVVSDGYLVTTTNEKGYYELKSAKKNKYVFISVPSGYEVSATGVLPKFSNKLIAAAATCERSDFELKKVEGQSNHTMLFFGDMHLAKRTNDKNQFQKFTNEINDYITAHPGEKVYAMTLGDMTWDLYWYSNAYSFPEYLNDVNNIKGLSIFHTIGNHDHDMKASGDWDTVTSYKNYLGPNYYSFNIGDVHYVVLDNIECTNTSGGTSDDRHYNENLVSDDLEWLAKDLSYVDKTTPVVVTMHASMYNQTGGASLKNATALENILSGRNACIVTGHTHKMWTIAKSSGITEYNSGAVCAAWWWCGYYTAGLNIAQDGAPGGYRVMKFNGKTQESHYKGTGCPDNHQFRTYDRNRIAIKASDYCTTSDDAAKLFDAALTKYGKYNTASSANEVLINIWDYNDKWKIDVTEVETSKKLNPSRVTYYDPLYLIAYCAKRFNDKATSLSFAPFGTYHMFKVTASNATNTLNIKITDDEGREYTETMTRPKDFNIDMYVIK